MKDKKENICKNCKMNQNNKCVNKSSPNYGTQINEVSNCNDSIPIYGNRSK